MNNRTFQIHISIVHKMHGFVSFAPNHSESIYHRNLKCKRYVNQIVNLFLSLSTQFISALRTRSVHMQISLFCHLICVIIHLAVQPSSFAYNTPPSCCVLWPEHVYWYGGRLLFYFPLRKYNNNDSLASGQFRRVLNSRPFFRCSLLAD